MTFGEALTQAKQGKAITREGWNGKGMFVYLTEGSRVPAMAMRVAVLHEMEGEVFDIRPHLDMKTADGSIQIGWLASQTDMLADDWRVAEA
ncbi:MAG: DUF2829 domain-containing protein [Treponematales bacterium]